MHAHDVQIHTYRLLSLKIYLAIKHDRAEKDLQAVPTNLFSPPITHCRSIYIHHQSLTDDSFDNFNYRLIPKP